ncbi:MAG: RnfABCDGE type electron transport complex subunit D [Clostridiales bacterium]|jgi:electron transport complex protein RnfD|nr:RnfABCDGE type electron transport complex subunit D [Clostridiales bacterium]
MSNHVDTPVLANPEFAKTRRNMSYVLIALAPTTLVGVYFFGISALLVVLVSVLSSVAFEWIYQKLAKKPITINDLSATVTGLLMGLTLPPSIPLWMPVVGSFVAIIIVKQLFGGLGKNFLNPALVGRGFLAISYAAPMSTGFRYPLTGWLNVDTVSAATPLLRVNANGVAPVSNDYIMALFGNIPGSIGETAAIALLIGGLFLLITKTISWHIPVAFIGTTFLMTHLLGEHALYQILLGGLLLGAFFMATDPSSSPISPLGKILFGVGAGVLVVFIRLFGGYPEGVAFAILLMNLVVPLIDRFIKPRARKVSE